MWVGYVPHVIVIIWGSHLKVDALFCWGGGGGEDLGGIITFASVNHSANSIEHKNLSNQDWGDILGMLLQMLVQSRGPYSYCVTCIMKFLNAIDLASRPPAPCGLYFAASVTLESPPNKSKGP